MLQKSFVWLICAMLSGSHAAWAQEGPQNHIAISAKQASAMGIKTVALASVTQGAGAGYPARAVIPNNQLRVISAPLEGIVEAVLAAAGQAVEKGQTLAELKSPSLVDEQRQLLNALSAAQVARSALNRDDELLKEGIIARSRYQTTRSAATQADADLEETRQTLALFGMQPEEIKALENSQKITNTIRIVSPLDGFVLEQMATAGQRVAAADPLYKVGFLMPMWVEIQLPAAQAARVKISDKVSIQNSGASGRIISMGKSLDAATQTIMVRAEITQNTGALHPEQLVVAAIEVTGSGAKQWQLPPAAVARQDGRPYVFVKTPDGFRAQPVTVENESASATTISGPLKDSDLIAIDGVLAVKGKWQGLGGGE